jgi:hypothetical protein
MADILHRAKNEPSFAFYLPPDKPMEKRHFEQEAKPSGYQGHVKGVSFDKEITLLDRYRRKSRNNTGPGISGQACWPVEQ